MLIRTGLTAICLFTVAATVAQAQQAGQCNKTLKQITEIKMEQASDGRWLVPITLNGAAKKMLLDTSTVPTTLFSDYAAEANLSLTDVAAPTTPGAPPPSTGRSRGGDASAAPGGPAASGKVAQVQSFSLGAIPSNGGYFKVSADNRKDRALDAAIVGLLGTDMLSKNDFDLDFGAKSLKLFSSDHCPNLVYWNGPTVAVEFFVDQKDHIRFPVMVDGKEMSASMSTAATQNEMSLVFGKRKLLFSVDEPGFEKVADKQPEQYSHRFKSVDLGGLAIQNPLIVVVDDSKTNKIQVNGTGSAGRTVIMDRNIPDLTLGTAFLNKFHVYVAAKEFKIYVTPAVAQ